MGYVATLALVSAFFMRYAMPFQFVLFGFVPVLVFFTYSNSLTMKWQRVKRKLYTRNLFIMALLIRITYVVFIYFYYIQMTGRPHAFYAADDEEDNFVWLKEQVAEDNMLAFIRQDKKRSFICVFNFANADREKYFIGVDREGKYREIFSSENGGICEGPTVAARKGRTDGWQYNIRIQIPALCVKIYQYIPFSAEEKAEIKRREEERERKRREEEALREKLKAERNRLRHSLKDELARKIAAAEEAIAAGSEIKGKKKK